MYEQQLVTALFTLEGVDSDLKDDRGGPTLFGVSSRVFPEVYEALRSGTMSTDQLGRFYIERFMHTIPQWDILSRRSPMIGALLFFGKVHGSGDEEYTSAIQTYLNELGYSLKVDGVLGPISSDALLSVSRLKLRALEEALIEQVPSFIKQRQIAVGSYANGIANRVRKEFDFAVRFKAGAYPLVSDVMEQDPLITVEKDDEVQDWITLSILNFEIKLRRWR
jgi:lysozyme family protein